VTRLRNNFPEEEEIIRLETTVNVLVGLNFNKPSMVEYFQQKIPVWVAIGDVPNPHTNLIPSRENIAFNPFQEAVESISEATFPVRVKGYDEQAPSLKDAIKASVAVSM